MNLDNGAYGNDYVLARYCGLQGRVPPIWGYLQHGWTERLLERGDKHSRYWPVLCYTDRQVRVLEREHPEVPAAVPIGAPFLYLQRLLDHDARAESARGAARGVVAYPLHHWAVDLTEAHLREHSLLAALLVDRWDLPDVLVVLHWSDWEKPAVRATYEQHGLAVTTHGRPREDRMFLFKQMNLLSRRSTYVTNAMGTSLMYAASLGLAASVVDFTAPGLPGPGRQGERSLDVYLERNRELFPQIYAGGLSSGESLELGRNELGWDYLRNPDDLRAILGWELPARARSEVARAVKTTLQRVRRVGA